MLSIIANSLQYCLQKQKSTKKMITVAKGFNELMFYVESICFSTIK